jgi:hypothetical protein
MLVANDLESNILEKLESVIVLGRPSMLKSGLSSCLFLDNQS